VAGELAICIFIKYSLDRILINFRLPWDNPSVLHRYLFLGCWRALWFIGLATVYWLIRRMFEEAEQRGRLETSMADLRFANLQQQINPHFLFNTLNFVYNAVLKTSAPAANALGRLSEMIRYGLSSHSLSSLVPLTLEIEQIENLIELNRLRFNNQLHVSYQFEGVTEKPIILPMVLLTFTENLFKHGDLSDPANPATIHISVKEGTMLFTTWDRKKRIRDSRDNGTGIVNSVKRLEHTYGKKYTLEISDNPADFTLSLRIAL
jgi:sensor histidine kinase YesM